jgi:fatty aldehyde-generating acyl-ACP reductase
MSVDFALIGHLEDWDAAASVVSALRGRDLPPIPADELRTIVPWLPARTVCRVVVRSAAGVEARGIYIDTFIPPDRLDNRFLRENLGRVREAAQYAAKEGAGVATLGGFTSILLEGRLDGLPETTQFTTGNTMTVALIVHGIERALSIAGRNLAESAVLIIGATGDVGSGCARSLALRTRRLLLSARNPARLETLRNELRSAGAVTVASTVVDALAHDADVVICCASLAEPAFALESLPAHAIVCDAGYPKNVRSGSPVIFFGGLGRVSAGFRMSPDLEGILNRHPYPYVAQGCLLEGMILGLERRYESFSRGRGAITPERVDEMWSMAQRHGIELAPLHNASGCVEGELAALRRIA